MKPQAFGTLFNMTGTCAIGAAREAIDCRDVWVVFKDTIYRNASCPVPDCGVARLSLDAIIIHLNDYHKWSREQIADFIELHHEPIPEFLVTDANEGEALTKLEEVDVRRP